MAIVGGDIGAPFQHVINALESVGSKVTNSGKTATAQCPAHEDENPSLSVSDDNGRVLLHCHAGCEPATIIDRLGLEWSDLGDIPSRAKSSSHASPTPTDEYVYTDSDGAPLFRVLRYEPKSFRQQGWNGSSWGSTLGNAPRVLYRLRDLTAAVAISRWVFVVEGEKDADRLVSLGFTATTVAMGSNLGNWDKTDTSVLDGASVAVVGDNDPPGRKYARHVASSLLGRAAEVRLLQLNGLADKGDISDWLDGGKTKADLEAVLASTPAWKPRAKFDGARPFATVGDVSVYAADRLRPWARKRTEWRIRGVLAKDTHLVVGAAKKTFKTTLVSGEMAFAIANGTPWLDHEQFAVEAQAPVVVVINEGIKSYMRMLDRIPARYEADSLGPIYVIDASGFKLENGDLNAAIRETTERVGAEVIIYDAWYGFVGGETDASNLFAMSDVFKIVQNIADELDIDPVIVHHLKKFSKGRPDLDHLTFAGIAEWADSWLLMVHRSNPRPEDGEFWFGLIAGSRQWGEIAYEVDASFGKLDVDNAGYAQPPKWHVASVDADAADRWGRKSGGSRIDPEPSLVEFIAAHPYEYTKSQVYAKAPGAEKANRNALEHLVKSGLLAVTKIRRLEGHRTVLRDLVGPTDIDPAHVEQQSLVPIEDDLPTKVAQRGAGNSPEAAVSAPTKSPTEDNPGDAANVGNVDTPTLLKATTKPAEVGSQGSLEGDGSSNSTRSTVTDRIGEPPDPVCHKCWTNHPPPPPGEVNWECYGLTTERASSIRKTRNL